MAEKQGRQYLVILSVYVHTAERLAEVVPGLTAVLDEVSTEPKELAFRSISRDVFGYLIRSKLPARAIRVALESPQRRDSRRDGIMVPGFLRNEDQLLITEVGGDYDASQGLSRALTWLQHH